MDALVVDGHPLRIDRPLVEFRINNPEPLLACTIQVGRSERAGRTSFDVRYAPTRGVMIGHPDLRSLTRRNPVTGRFNPSLDRNELREALGPTLLVAWELLAELAHGIFPLPGFRLPRNKVRLKYIDLQRRYWHNEPEGADCQLHLWREVSPGMWGPVDRYYDDVRFDVDPTGEVLEHYSRKPLDLDSSLRRLSKGAEPKTVQAAVNAAHAIGRQIVPAKQALDAILGPALVDQLAAAIAEGILVDSGQKSRRR